MVIIQIVTALLHPHVKVWQGPSAAPLVISMFFVCSLFLEGTHYFLCPWRWRFVCHECVYSCENVLIFPKCLHFASTMSIFDTQYGASTREHTDTHTHTLIAACKLPPQRLSSWLERAMETSGKEAETAELGSGKHTHTRRLTKCSRTKTAGANLCYEEPTRPNWDCGASSGSWKQLSLGETQT